MTFCYKKTSQNIYDFLFYNSHELYVLTCYLFINARGKKDHDIDKIDEKDKYPTNKTPLARTNLTKGVYSKFKVPVRNKVFQIHQPPPCKQSYCQQH